MFDNNRYILCSKHKYILLHTSYENISSYVLANINSYSHYIFATLDQEENGIITFEVKKNPQHIHNSIIKLSKIERYAGTYLHST